MTVETLNEMMTYVIEGWVLLSASYLSVGFAVSFSSRARNGLKAKAEVNTATSEEAINAERVAEVTAVAEKYGKAADKTTVQTGVSVPGK